MQGFCASLVRAANPEPSRRTIDWQRLVYSLWCCRTDLFSRVVRSWCRQSISDAEYTQAVARDFASFIEDEC